MARHFEDSLNRTWTIDLADRRVVKRVRKIADIDLREFGQGKMPIKETSSRQTFVTVLWACLGPQAVACGLDKSQFVQMLSVSDWVTLRRATAALLRSIIETFIPSRHRPRTPARLPGEF